MAKIHDRFEQPVRVNDSTFLQAVFDRDVDLFGVPSAIALAELNSETSQLNRTYLKCLQARSLQVLPQTEDWYGYRVRVFLRHDTVFVFAIAFQSWIGMANSVSLSNARFCVDEFGRQQTNSKRGPLKNFSTVHAWIEGTLLSLSNAGQLPSVDFDAVVYRPDLYSQFTLRESGRAIVAAAAVQMIPGQDKVWAQGYHKAEAVSSHMAGVDL